MEVRICLTPPPSLCPFCWNSGGEIGEKPDVVAGRIEIRKYLSLTVSVDHDILDGAPETRFARRLRELMETGYGIDAFIEPV